VVPPAGGRAPAVAGSAAGRSLRSSAPSASSPTGPSTIGTIRVPLSPPSCLRQLYEEACALSRCARNEQRENLFLQLAALAAADKEEEAKDKDKDEE